MIDGWRLAFRAAICYAPPMGFFASTRPSRILFPLALIGLIVAVAFIPVVDLDIWWHLSTGWIITTLHQIPKSDPFSFTAFGAPWVNHEWLFEVGAWLLYAAGGVAALTVFKLAAASAIAAIVFRTTDLLARSPGAALWGTAAVIWASSNRIMERPFLVGLVLLALFALVLYRYARTGSRLLWLLPPLQILWVNTHGGALFGVQLLFAFALGESLQAAAHRRLGGPEPIPAERRRRLWLAAFACLAASVVNPWGIETLLFPFRHLRMAAIVGGTQEWLPLMHPSLDRILSPVFALACLAAVLVAFVVNRRRVRCSQLLLVALVASLLLQSHRFIPDFVVIAVPILAGQIAEIVRALAPARPPSWRPTWANLVAVFTLSALAMVHGIPVVRGNAWLKDAGFGATIDSAPERLVDFLEAHNIRGRVFNDMGMGGYLIFRRWPRERVFIDGRTPVFGDDFFRRTMEAFRNSRNFEELDREFDFDYAVFPGYSLYGNFPFHEYLWGNPRWRLVYLQNDGAIYLKDIPKFRPLIRTHALATNPLVDHVRREDERRRKAAASEAAAPAAAPSPGCAPFPRR